MAAVKTSVPGWGCPESQIRGLISVSQSDPIILITLDTSATASLPAKAVHSRRWTGAVPSGDYCNISLIHIGLAISMMARVAGRAAQRARRDRDGQP